MNANQKEKLKVLLEYKLFWLLSITYNTLLLSIILGLIVSLSYLKIITVFLGLEGSILLAFALIPSWEASAGCPQKGFRQKLLWWITEGSKRQVLISFNPIAFYFGLIFLLLSILFSALT